MPMINIIFLLLVFFMIAAQINLYPGLINPKSSSETSPDHAALLIVINADSTVLVDGIEINGSLEEHLGSLDLATDARVAVRVDRGLPATVLDPVIAHFLDSRGIKLQIITESST